MLLVDRSCRAVEASQPARNLEKCEDFSQSIETVLVKDAAKRGIFPLFISFWRSAGRTKGKVLALADPVSPRKARAIFAMQEGI